jgi:hypothetical protein
VLDKKLMLMLETATTLTADDLDCLRGAVRAGMIDMADDADAPATSAGADTEEEACSDEHAPTDEVSPAPPVPRATQTAQRRSAASSSSNLSAGEYERQRTRESKVSTACIGNEREKHDWWPIGTTLVGRIGSEAFTATVVENTKVKSNRSLLITSGPASGRICITPTRAAMEATEAYRHAHNLGRGGGVTNGWEFWKAQA